MLIEDILISTARLIEGSGGTEFETSWSCPHTPGEEEGHHCDEVVWVSSASWNGHRRWATASTPEGSYIGLAATVLRNSTCRCNRPIALSDDADGCRWKLLGNEWAPSCDAEPLHMPAGARGDLDAMAAALASRHRPGPATPNRAERRRQQRRRGGQGR